MMIRFPSKCLMICLVLAVAWFLPGCTSQTEQTSTTTTAAPVTTAKVVSESCTVCHAAGRTADIITAHKAADAPVTVTIDAVTMKNTDGVINMKVDFRMRTGATPVVGAAASTVRFTVAKLKPGSSGNVDTWQSYINRKVTKAAGIGTAPDGYTAIQATSETATATGGVFTENGNGSYSYTLSQNFAKITAPLAVAYEPTLTHRVAMQVAGNVSNPIYEFRPSDGATTGIASLREVSTASCNDCHHRLALHGGDRVETEYCVTCHNPGTIDENSANTVDFKVMTHKIHRGKNLPSVKAGGEYAIWGYGNSKLNFSEVGYPQDLRNCTKCHVNAPDSDNWKKVPTMEACGSCHDSISFAAPAPAKKVLHTGGPIDGNGSCANCHTQDKIVTAHKIPEKEASVNFSYKINGIVNTKPGQYPEVTFSVLNAAGAPYNILKDAPFTATATGVSRLAVIIGWDTKDYTNAGSGSKPAQPISIDTLKSSKDNGNGTFTVTSAVAIPSDAVGTGVVAIEGHPAAADKAGKYTLRVPVKSVLSYFPITDATPVPRRTVADASKNCDKCHGTLSLHGSNRTDEIGVCVICHNGRATDINRRPAAPAVTADGKKEQSIDFKNMIHAIHASGKQVPSGFRQKGIVVYGYGNSVNAFGEVTYPGNLGKCDACHVAGTYTLPLNDNVQTTAVGTGTDLASSADDKYSTPVTSVCSSCHDADLPALHMKQNGGAFDLGGAATPGAPVRVQPPGHSTAPNCTTANACHN